VAKAIDTVLNNVQFKYKDTDFLHDLATQWLLCQQRKYHQNPTYGVVAAGDGLIIKIKALSKKELTKIGIHLGTFWNRKGFYGINAQVFCDAWCRIVMFECNWPGSTGDITAYPQTAFFINDSQRLSMSFLNDSPAAKDFYLALDEAYKSIKDGKHITPFPGVDISAAVADGDLEAARVMRSFNKIFCSDRITAERTFGQLVRKWGMLWSALSFNTMADIQLCLRVCVKLHNLSVDDWLCNKFSYASPYGERGEDYPMPRLPLTVYEILNSCADQPEMPPPEDGVEGLADSDLLGPGMDTDDANVNAGRAMANRMDEDELRRQAGVDDSRRV
jgi:hypothetical protein